MKKFLAVFVLGVVVGWSTYEKVHGDDNIWSVVEQ